MSKNLQKTCPSCGIDIEQRLDGRCPLCAAVLVLEGEPVPKLKGKFYHLFIKGKGWALRGGRR